VEESPINFTVRPVLEISIRVEQLPNAPICSCCSFKNLRNARLVVVERIRDEGFATYALQGFFERFKFRVVERYPLLFLACVAGAVGELQQLPVQYPGINCSEPFASNLCNKFTLEALVGC